MDIENLIEIDKTNKFEAGRNARLDNLYFKLNVLMDEFHADTYLRDDIWRAASKLSKLILDEKKEPKIIKYRY